MPYQAIYKKNEDTRRTFSFAALNGNVERFEVRYERERLEGLVEAGEAAVARSDVLD